MVTMEGEQTELREGMQQGGRERHEHRHHSCLPEWHEHRHHSCLQEWHKHRHHSCLQRHEHPHLMMNSTCTTMLRKALLATQLELHGWPTGVTETTNTKLLKQAREGNWRCCPT